MGQQNQLNKGTPDSLQFISSGRSYVDPTGAAKVSTKPSHGVTWRIQLSTESPVLPRDQHSIVKSLLQHSY